MIAQLHGMGDVANADVSLRGGNDLTRFYTAATLDQLAIEPGLFEISDPIGHKLGLIDWDSDRIDDATRHICRQGASVSYRQTATCDDGQGRTPGNVGHHARSFSLAAAFSSALNIASPISAVESFFAPVSAMSAVLAPDRSAAATALSSKSASSGRFSVMRNIMATLRMEPSGFAMPLPAMSGALP